MLHSFVRFPPSLASLPAPVKGRLTRAHLSDEHLTFTRRCFERIILFEGEFMKKGILLRFGAFALTIGIAPFTMCGSIIDGSAVGTIKGTTTGKTVTGVGPDDLDTTTTINVSYQTFCPWIVAGATAYPAFNFVFAGQGVASGI